ncbi:MAG: 4Fe-4S binding protein [bacterium]
MKKLSRKHHNSNTYYTLSDGIVSKVYNDGFSGLIFDTGNIERGVCIHCDSKLCVQYLPNELESKLFASFPHNTSNRVCPTDAIKISDDGSVYIDETNCIVCGLCLYRCPTAAIQLDIANKRCSINTESQHKVISTKEDQSLAIRDYQKLPQNISFNSITEEFAIFYTSSLQNKSIKTTDISEILVRNSLLNLGVICNTNASGNNHIRIEFFAESGKSIIVGESNIKNSDSLAVTRRILDDLSVLIGRYGFSQEQIIPLAVLNGLPNKRTDYYEVIEDVKNVLGIQINTITYHILFILNLFCLNVDAECLAKFIVTRDTSTLLDCVKALKNDIEQVDKNINGVNYQPNK